MKFPFIEQPKPKLKRYIIHFEANGIEALVDGWNDFSHHMSVIISEGLDFGSGTIAGGNATRGQYSGTFREAEPDTKN